MRPALLAVLLFAAVGASAALAGGAWSRHWYMLAKDAGSYGVSEEAGKVLFVLDANYRHELTNDEAASLGRALLEAAGETARDSELKAVLDNPAWCVVVPKERLCPESK